MKTISGLNLEALENLAAQAVKSWFGANLDDLAGEADWTFAYDGLVLSGDQASATLIAKHKTATRDERTGDPLRDRFQARKNGPVILKTRISCSIASDGNLGQVTIEVGGRTVMIGSEAAGKWLVA